MSDKWRRLGASSEMLALSSMGQAKNVMVCLIDVIGSVDVELMFQSARKAVLKFPQLHSVLMDIKTRGLHRLEWSIGDPNILPVFFHDLSRKHLNDDPMGNVLFTLNSRLDREWDLLKEMSSEFHCIKLSDERFLFGWLIHHAAGDASIGSDVGKDTLLIYSEMVHGPTPDPPVEYLSFSGSRKRAATSKKMRLSDYLRDARQTVQNLLVSPTYPVGSGKKSDLRQHHSKRVLSEDESARLQSRIKSNGLSLIDTLVAATHYAIDDWNMQRNIKPGFLTSSVSVSMRGRFRGLDQENSSSLIFFESSPENRSDSTKFLKSLAMERIRHFRKQKDLKLAENIKVMVNIVRIFPYRLRKKLISFITNQHNFSAAVTFLGVIWPKIENGKLTADSALTQLGGLQIQEVMGIPYKMLSRTKTLFMVYIFRNRLNFALSTSASLFTREENEEFLDLVIKRLSEF